MYLYSVDIVCRTDQYVVIILNEQQKENISIFKPISDMPQ